MLHSRLLTGTYLDLRFRKISSNSDDYDSSYLDLYSDFRSSRETLRFIIFAFSASFNVIPVDMEGLVGRVL